MKTDKSPSLFKCTEGVRTLLIQVISGTWYMWLHPHFLDNVKKQYSPIKTTTQNVRSTYILHITY